METRLFRIFRLANQTQRSTEVERDCEQAKNHLLAASVATDSTFRGLEKA